MQIIINEKKIKRNKLIGQVTTFASLAVLAVGLVFAFAKNDMTKTLLSYVALIIGFILSQIGIFYTNRYGRTPRLDEVISTSLQKLTNEYTLFVYKSPAPILLVGPVAIWIPMPITASGTITYYKGRWRQAGGGFLMKVFGQEGLGKPDIEAAHYKEEITKKLKETLGIAYEIPPIKPILVPIMKNSEIGDVTEAPTPIVLAAKLKRTIRHEDRQCTTPLLPEEVEKIIKALEID